MSRIAYISSTFPDYQKCGTGIYAGYLTKALAQQGHDIHVITTAIPEIKSTFGKVTVHKVMQSWGLTDLPRLMHVFQQIKPDLIHINHPTSIAGAKPKILVNVLPEINRQLWKLPVITTLHEFGHVSLLGKAKLLPLVYSSDALTVTNSRYKQQVEKYLPASRRSKVHVVNIGSQFGDNRPKGDRNTQRERWGLKPSDKVVGFVGFITPPKGFHHLVDSLAPLLREQKDVKILALSSWNLSSAAYRQQILDRIEAQGITGQVIFSGYLEDEDLWDAMAAIDVAAFAFDFPVEDRSSGPLRQVLHYGLPTVVFADDTHYNEFGLKHGENIWLSPFKNLDQFRNDVSHLLLHPELQATLSEGTKALRHEFSFDAVSNSMSRLYSLLLRH